METEKSKDRTPGENQAHQVALLCSQDLNDELTIILSEVHMLIRMLRIVCPQAVQHLDDIGAATLRITKYSGALAIFSSSHGAQSAPMTMEERIDQIHASKLF